MKIIKEICICTSLALGTLFILISLQYGCKQKDNETKKIVLDVQDKKINYEDTLQVVEKMPEFKGGVDVMMKYLKENIKYPQQAREEGTTGMVFVSFVVNKFGKISNIKLLRGIGSGCDEEAIRVIKMMPDWLPGKQDGIPVCVQFNLPIKFSLQ